MHIIMLLQVYRLRRAMATSHCSSAASCYGCTALARAAYSRLQGQNRRGVRSADDREYNGRAVHAKLLIADVVKGCSVLSFLCVGAL